MSDDDSDLRDAAAEWLKAERRLAAAQQAADEDPDEYPVVLELAEELTLAKLSFQQSMIRRGWTPPAKSRTPVDHGRQSASGT